MWDPLDEKTFERTKPASGNISYSVSALTDSDLSIAADQYFIFKKTGKWPIDDTIINQIWLKHSDEIKCDTFNGRLIVGDLICREVAFRWSSGSLDSSKLK